MRTFVDEGAGIAGLLRELRRQDTAGGRAYLGPFQEIADELGIAPSTAKSHTNHIYGKLGVKNRTQAIARAGLLGLL